MTLQEQLTAYAVKHQCGQLNDAEFRVVAIALIRDMRAANEISWLSNSLCMVPNAMSPGLTLGPIK